MDKVIYRTFSSILFIKYMLTIVACGGLIFVLGYHYSENPDVFFYFILIILVFMLFIHFDVIEIYQDKFVFKTVYAFGIYSRKKTYDYYFVKKIGFVGDFNADNDLAEDVMDLLIPSPLHTKDYLNHIEIEMPDGTTQSIKTRIYKKEIKAALTKMLEKSSYKETIARNEKLTQRVKSVE